MLSLVKRSIRMVELQMESKCLQEFTSIKLRLGIIQKLERW